MALRGSSSPNLHNLRRSLKMLGNVNTETSDLLQSSYEDTYSEDPAYTENNSLQISVERENNPLIENEEEEQELVINPLIVNNDSQSPEASEENSNVDEDHFEILFKREVRAYNGNERDQEEDSEVKLQNLDIFKDKLDKKYYSGSNKCLLLEKVKSGSLAQLTCGIISLPGAVRRIELNG